eukprot:scaffold4278_cov173-Amphora_coffeaeformis.AAC.5
MSRLVGRKIVIVGGGPIGLATAVHLGRQGLGSSAVVIERDASYSTCNDNDCNIVRRYSVPAECDNNIA